MSSPGIRPNPWSWRISFRPWFAFQASRLSAWQPKPVLEVSPSLPEVLAKAALRQEGWVYHPLLSAVTLAESNESRDLRLLVWAAANNQNGESLDSVVVTNPTWIWNSDGGAEIEPGRYDLKELAGRFIKTSNEISPIALDVWIDSVGLPLPDGIVDYEHWSWSHVQPLAVEDEQRLQRELVGFLGAVETLKTLLPECAAWVSAVTKVVVPLRGTPETRFRSGSSAAIPGLIFTDIDGPVEQIIESLVHESSHHWFCVAEMAGPLVDPLSNLTYKSPLRSDPRPLRGIFLAFHALAFMSAFYRDWAIVRSNVLRIQKMLDSVVSLRDDAYTTLQNARSELTDYGRAFLDRTTEQVVSYAN